MYFIRQPGDKLNRLGAHLVQKIVSVAVYLLGRCLMYVSVTGPLLIVVCMSCVILIGLTECVIMVHTII